MVGAVFPKRAENFPVTLAVATAVVPVAAASIYSGTTSIADTVAYPVTGTNSSSNLPCAFGSRPRTTRTSG